MQKSKFNVGDKFYKLTVKSNYDGSHNLNSTNPTIFICDCGNEHTATLNNVSRGVVKHCKECSAKKKSKLHKTHGHSIARKDIDPIGYKCYYTWQAMKRRCYNPQDSHYDRYGGRGIEICSQWINSYETFLNDMGTPPTKDHTIEREDNNGNYEPSNCRWATKLEQANNKSNNRNITAFGKTQTLAQWAKEVGLPRETIARRINRGYKEEKALTAKGIIRKRVYSTPYGDFNTINEVSQIIKRSLSSTHSRFSSATYPDYKIIEIE